MSTKTALVSDNNANTPSEPGFLCYKAAHYGHVKTGLRKKVAASTTLLLSSSL